MRLKSLDNCIIQNNNMMQYIVHYFSELNKKKRKELHQPLAIRIYKSCNYVFTLQGSKNNIYTFSTKSLVGA